MKPYLTTLALATLLLSHSSTVLAAPAGQVASKQNKPKPVFTAGMVLMPRYNHAEHDNSAQLPLLGVPSVPEAGWLWSGSKIYADAKWQPSSPLIDKAHAHVGVSWSDVEDKLLADHVFLTLQKHNTSVKVGRYPPFAQPRMLGMSSLLLSNILADDHWHVDGIQLRQDNLLSNLTGNTSLTLGAYAEGAYLGDSAEDDNGMGQVATAHLGLAWQDKTRQSKGASSNNSPVTPHMGVALQVLYAPDVIRIAKLQSHTHGSVLSECKLSSATCFDGQSGLLWLHGFWHSDEQTVHHRPRYGVDTILALQQLQGKLNTPISSADVDSKQWHVLTDVFYQPANIKYTLRAETMQTQHDVTGLNARQTAKDVGIEDNSHNPWRIGVQADVPMVKGLMLSPAVFWDDSRKGDAEVVYSLGLHYKLMQ